MYKNRILLSVLALVMIASGCKKEEPNYLIGEWGLTALYNTDGMKVQHQIGPNNSTRKLNYVFTACTAQNKCQINYMRMDVYSNGSNGGGGYKSYSYNGESELIIKDTIFIIDILNKEMLSYHMASSPLRKYEFTKLSK